MNCMEALHWQKVGTMTVIVSQPVSLIPFFPPILDSAEQTLIVSEHMREKRSRSFFKDVTADLLSVEVTVIICCSS